MIDQDYIDQLRTYVHRIQISVHRLDTLEGLAKKSIEANQMLLKELDSIRAGLFDLRVGFSDLMETVDDHLSSIKIGLTD